MRQGKLQVRISLSVLALCFTLAAISVATKKPPPKPVNINAANSEELQQVPGIGPATAEKILQMRKSYGSFKSVDDLLSIKGIGKKRLEKMRKYLTVTKSTVANKVSRPAVSVSPLKKPEPSGVVSSPAEAEEPPN
ncbi:MAG: competence protein ComEA [Candidatus Acidoferrum typicum]|nr:competence protein ComEA [Candidatus Acidoferrum typicum]